MLAPEIIASAAEALFEAEKSRTQIRPLTLDYPDITLDDAYAIQRAWVDKKIETGDRITGYKIGLTSKAMQQAMNIDTPDFGILLSSMAYDNGAEINAAQFSDPRVEVELAFIIRDHLAGEAVSVEEVLAATDCVVPAIELIDARSFRTDPETGYTRKVFDTIADNAANAGYTLGDERHNPKDIDLRWSGGILYRNGEVEETGLAAGVLDHPARGICWVCKRFAPHGVGLKPGQVVLSGSFTRPVAVKPGDQITCDYGALGSISLSFK